jgi:hypothetical protein
MIENALSVPQPNTTHATLSLGFACRELHVERTHVGFYPLFERSAEPQSSYELQKFSNILTQDSAASASHTVRPSFFMMRTNTNTSSENSHLLHLLMIRVSPRSLIEMVTIEGRQVFGVEFESRKFLGRNVLEGAPRIYWSNPTVIVRQSTIFGLPLHAGAGKKHRLGSL